LTLQFLFRELLQRLDLNPTSKDSAEELRQLCCHVVAELKKDFDKPTYYNSRRVSTANVANALDASVQLSQKQLFIDILASESRYLSPAGPIFIGEGIALFGFDLVEPR
jgi:hypothetical protein